MTVQEYISSKLAVQWAWIQQATPAEMKAISNDIVAIVRSTPNNAENYVWRRKLMSMSSTLNQWSDDWS